MRIQLDGISKSYDKKILNNINLDIDGYKTIAIIGKSGCGKSTLLRLMSGIEKPDCGQIVIDKTLLGNESLRVYQDSISLVFQQHNLFPHLSLLENITLILSKIRRLSESEAHIKASELLTKLHLSEEMYKKPRFVSGGQAQRASIARALSTSPKLIYMDEPTAALDPILTSEVLDAVLELKESGTKFVFVTHELSFVKKFADYVIFMDQGEIIEEGPVGILDLPKTLELDHFMRNERRS